MRLITGCIVLCLAAVLSAQPSPTPADIRMAGYQQRRALQEASLLKNVEFENIGPTIFSGRVTDIDANPENPSHFYVAYASGGLWYTENNGASFTPVFDHEAAMSIGDIAVDWPRGIIWVGTGENNSSRSSYSGVGIFRSDDGGKTWEHRGLAESQHIGRILLDAENSDVLWVAVTGNLYSPSSDRGLYKTTDGGRTWKRTLFVNANAGAIDIVRSPVNPSTLYAATWERTRRAWNFTESGPGSGIYHSGDGGETWRLLTTVESGFPTGDGVGRIGLDITQENGRDVIYAIVDNYERRPPKPAEDGVLTKAMLRNMSSAQFLELDEKQFEKFLEDNGFPEKYTVDTVFQLVKEGTIQPLTLVQYLEDANALLFDTEVIGAEVYRSSDNGMTWTMTHDNYLDQFYYSYGYYFGQIRVAPHAPQKLYILGVPILKSEDGGKSWVSLDADNVHVDHHALWVNKSRDGHLILGNDGGINFTYDDGRHWFKCNSPAVGQFYTVHTDRAKPYHVYGGLQDNGVWGGSHLYRRGPGWQSTGDYHYDYLFGGDGMQVQVDFRDNRTVYTGLQFGNYARLDKVTEKYSFITPRHDLTERPYRWNWQTPIWLSRHQQDILYIGSQFLHRSLDQGAHFETISGDLTQGGKPGDVPYGTLTTIHESPLEFGLLYTGSDDGLIYVTRDFGRTWTRISDALPRDLWVSRVRASAHRKGRVYVSLNGYRWDHFDAYVFVSEDFGETWKRIGTDLPPEPVNVIIEDPVNENVLYVGTDHGLYISLDRGMHFQGTGSSLPDVSVHDLDIQPVENHLLVGTHGRSLYKADISQIQALNTEVLAKAVHLFPIPASGIRADGRWGERRAEWMEYRIPEVKIPVYISGAGKVHLRLMKGDLELFGKVFDLNKGLNYLSYDLSVDRKSVERFQEILDREDAGIIVKPAQNGVVYLKKGSYDIVVSKDGSSEKQPLELK